jgi:competence protein ComEA
MLKRLIAVALMLFTAMAMAAVDVNKASEAELDGIKGVGPATTQLIMAERKKAAFKDWNDLISRVKGIGEARASKLSKDGLTVNGASFIAVGAPPPAKPNAKNEAREAKK